MTFLRATLTGNLRDAMKAEVRSVATALKKAVASTGQDVQGQLRAQARAAGFRDGGRAVANAWRLTVYPRPGVGPDTFRPAAQVVSKVPDIVDAFDKGQMIRAKGNHYLAYPTGYNATAGRRGGGRRGGMRVTPAEMLRLKGEAFVIPTKNPRIKLWCLKVREARGTTRRTRNRVRLFVNSNTEVLTGRRKGQQANVKEQLKRGFVPMFFLATGVQPGKRLDLDSISRTAVATLASNIVTELDRR